MSASWGPDLSVFCVALTSARRLSDSTKPAMGRGGAPMPRSQASEEVFGRLCVRAGNVGRPKFSLRMEFLRVKRVPGRFVLPSFTPPS